jgi:hypothetical protein
VVGDGGVEGGKAGGSAGGVDLWRLVEGEMSEMGRRTAPLIYFWQTLGTFAP